MLRELTPKQEAADRLYRLLGARIAMGWHPDEEPDDPKREAEIERHAKILCRPFLARLRNLLPPTEQV